MRYLVEEADFLDDFAVLKLNNHRSACYHQIPIIFLENLQDFMSWDSMIGSTVSTKSNREISLAIKISSPISSTKYSETLKISSRSYSKNKIIDSYQNIFWIIQDKY
jgi:hypothetical protein